MEKLKSNNNRTQKIEQEVNLLVGGKEFPARFQIDENGYFGFGNEKEQYGLGGKMINNKPVITHIIIRDDLRGINLGTVLLAGAEQRLRAQGFTEVFARFRNEKTIQFFQSKGYRIVEIGDHNHDLLLDDTERGADVVPNLLIKNLN